MGDGNVDLGELRKAEVAHKQQPASAQLPVEPEQERLLLNLHKPRESLASDEHPDPLSICLGFDVTGSMRPAHREMMTGGTTRMLEILLKIGADGGFYPQVLFAALADSRDRPGPLQLGEFESDNRMYQQLASIRTGGGAGSETMHEAGYLHALVFLARMTRIDCFDKAGRKGHAILVGDELPNDHFTTEEARKLFGLSIPRSLTIQEVIAEVRERWNITFILAHTDSYGARGEAQTLSRWRALLGEDSVLEVEGSALGLAHVMAVRIGILEGLMTAKSAVDHLEQIGTEEPVVRAVAKCFGLDPEQRDDEFDRV